MSGYGLQPPPLDQQVAAIWRARIVVSDTRRLQALDQAIRATREQQAIRRGEIERAYASVRGATSATAGV